MKDNTQIVFLFAFWLIFVSFLMVKFTPWFFLGVFLFSPTNHKHKH